MDHNQHGTILLVDIDIIPVDIHNAIHDDGIHIYNYLVDDYHTVIESLNISFPSCLTNCYFLWRILKMCYKHHFHILLHC